MFDQGFIDMGMCKSISHKKVSFGLRSNKWVGIEEVYSFRSSSGVVSLSARRTSSVLTT